MKKYIIKFLLRLLERDLYNSTERCYKDRVVSKICIISIYGNRDTPQYFCEIEDGESTIITANYSNIYDAIKKRNEIQTHIEHERNTRGDIPPR